MNGICDGCKEWFEDDELTVFTNPEGLGSSILCGNCSSSTGSGKV